MMDGFNAARLDFATLGNHEFDGSRSNLVARIDAISRRESPFGNMIADAMRRGTNADVALIKSGALRFDDMMPAGPITRHMIEGVFLLADETCVATFRRRGARLRELLEISVGRDVSGVSQRRRVSHSGSGGRVHGAGCQSRFASAHRRSGAAASGANAWLNRPAADRPRDASRSARTTAYCCSLQQAHHHARAHYPAHCRRHLASAPGW